MPIPGVREFLKTRAEGDLLPWKAQLEASRRSGATLAAVELEALEAGLLPMRYRRNRVTVTLEEQLRIFRSRVAVIGCGGRGGYLVEELARLGVGTLVLVDPGVFEEQSLNRQILSSPSRLGTPKVYAAAERVAAINPAITVAVHRVAFSATNARELLAGCCAALDGIADVALRRELAAACRELSIPLVHGAIAGWYGQVTVQLPGADITPLLSRGEAGAGVVSGLGNPSFTPAVVASLQVSETAKLLLGRRSTLAGKLLLLNLLDMKFDETGPAEDDRP